MRKQSERKVLKNVSPYEMISTWNKNQIQRQRILKQLEQIGLKTDEYQNCSLKSLLAKVQDIMRNTYSIKYLGLNKNEMGIISRRINPLADQQFKINDNIQESYSINKYFYPKPLKTGKKNTHSEKINVQNLESQIKKEFEQNMADIQKNKEGLTHQRFNSTKFGGSWYRTLPKTAKTEKAGARSPKNNASDLALNIEPKLEHKKSYSRFLNQGILIIRD